jgi:hypothetical protein
VWRIPDVYSGSRILIFTHPGSRIPDPKTLTKKRMKKMFCHTFSYSHKFHKIVNYFIFISLKKKTWVNFQRIKNYRTFNPKNCQKYGFGIRDPRSGIRDPEKTYSGSRIPHPGSRGQKGTGSRIRIRNTGHTTLITLVSVKSHFLMYF